MEQCEHCANVAVLSTWCFTARNLPPEVIAEVSFLSIIDYMGGGVTIKVVQCHLWKPIGFLQRLPNGPSREL